MAKRQFRFCVYLQVYRPIYFFLKNSSILVSLSLSLPLKLFYFIFTISLNTLHPRQLEKFLRWSLSLSKFIFFRKISSLCSLSLSLPLKLFSSEEFTEPFLLLIKTHTIRMKSEKFLRWSWNLSNFIFFPKYPTFLLTLSLSLPPSLSLSLHISLSLSLYKQITQMKIYYIQNLWPFITLRH